MAVTTYYEQDAELSVLKGKTIAVIGYGSQGHAERKTCATAGFRLSSACAKVNPSKPPKMTGLKYCR